MWVPNKEKQLQHEKCHCCHTKLWRNFCQDTTGKKANLFIKYIFLTTIWAHSFINLIHQTSQTI